MKPETRAAFLFIAVSCVEGAAGVGLAALAAHRYPSPELMTAAQMLVMHAGASLAVICVGLWCDRPSIFLFAAGAMALGAALFSADIACRVIWAGPLFPFAAPNGGILMIAGWIIGAFAALRVFFQSAQNE